MEISMRDMWTVLHGMGFGALFMLAFSGALMELYGGWSANPQTPLNQRGQIMLRVYMIAMVALAWLTVLSGAYVIYPWYRAAVPAGTIDLAGYPQKFLMSSKTTSEWHNLGMEWKEHVAWIAPIAMTMVAYVYWKYGRGVNKYRELRKAAVIFTLGAFLATAVAGGFGAFLNKYAPVRGGATIHLMNGE